jgi:hypothetical protein
LRIRSIFAFKSVAANDPLLRFKERAVRGVDPGDRDLAARGIPLPECFDQVLFHQRTEFAISV